MSQFRRHQLHPGNVLLFAVIALAGCGGSTSDTAALPEAGTTTAAMITAPAAPPDTPAAVDMNRLLNADTERGQWLSYGRTYNEQRFSPLDQINADNVGQLGLAWFLDLPTNQNVESTPLFIDGVLYLTLPWSQLQAIDARSGQVLWHYDPQVPG